MKKIFTAMLVVTLMNFAPVPAASAEVVALEISNFNFCGYGLFAKEREFIKQVEKNPKDAKVWHKLGHFYYSLERYQKALDAFEKAVALEPNNTEFKRDRDAALEKVKSGAEAKNNIPKFNGLG